MEFSNQSFELQAGVYFDFTSVAAEGVASFRITGIDTSEGLDPNNPQAFVTGLSFIDGGSDDFNIVMKPILAVPEPASWLLMLAGLVGCGLVVGSRRQEAQDVVC